MKKIALILLLAICFSIQAQTNPVTQQKEGYLSVEIDPAPFILKGYSLSLKYGPRHLSHFAFTASVYSAKFPDKMMLANNYEKGFRDLRIETSFAGFADYFIHEHRKGLHIGPSVFLYRKSVGRLDSPERAAFTTLYPNIRVGYVWQPFRKLDFYLNPWLNIGSEMNLDTKNVIGRTTFSANQLQYVLALHLGYRIKH
jgi:hypothetical protein